jgi:succinoglycan biosynthesis protein ExoH
LSKKTSSILIPLLIWNTLVAVALYFLQKHGNLSHSFTTELYPFHLSNWLNAITGLFENPANYPLNFLRDLYVISLLSPLYWIVLKKVPYIGLLCVLFVAYFNLDGYLVLRHDMMVSFYIGGLAATQSWDLKYLDGHAKWLLAIFITACFVIIMFDIENIYLFRWLSPFLIWPSMSLISYTRFGEFLYQNSKSSFFTFLAHGPVIFIIWVVFNQIPVDLPDFIYWLIALPLTVYVSIYFKKQLEKRMPGMALVMLGGR